MLGSLIASRVELDGRDPVDWFLRTALVALDERQAAANRDRHRAVAAEFGDRSYYARRDRLVRALGYRSLWDYRRSRWGR